MVKNRINKLLVLFTFALAGGVGCLASLFFLFQLVWVFTFISQPTAVGITISETVGTSFGFVLAIRLLQSLI